MELNVIDNRHVKFGDINIGQIFVAESTGEVYVKTSIISCENNCMRLEDGVHRECDSQSNVIIPVKVEVVV